MYTPSALRAPEGKETSEVIGGTIKGRSHYKGEVTQPPPN